MGGQGGLLGAQLDPDIAADLTDIHRHALITHRAEPQTQVIAFVNGLSRFLKPKVLWPAIEVQRTHG